MAAGMDNCEKSAELSERKLFEMPIKVRWRYKNL